MFKIISLVFILSCSTLSHKRAPDDGAPKDFSPRELITTSQMLTKIYDMQSPPLSCVLDEQAAELLLRTIRPRLEVVIDDIEAVLDRTSEVKSLVNNCENDCTCEFIDEIFREHQIPQTKVQIAAIKKGIAANEKVCLQQRRKQFCESALFKELDKEKSDFSFE